MKFDNKIPKLLTHCLLILEYLCVFVFNLTRNYNFVWNIHYFYFRYETVIARISINSLCKQQISEDSLPYDCCRLLREQNSRLKMLNTTALFSLVFALASSIVYCVMKWITLRYTRYLFGSTCHYQVFNWHENYNYLY